ncbi:methyl-accepting chemotaxis protein [Acrasis kona]|uniref:Methyl-accepting chemotaxis protein n=1 Tax=Acrasis kona TaxID=1008807 RepID=A0AAW2ZPV2_9EUKA
MSSTPITPITPASAASSTSDVFLTFKNEDKNIKSHQESYTDTQALVTRFKSSGTCNRLCSMCVLLPIIYVIQIITVVTIVWAIGFSMSYTSISRVADKLEDQISAGIIQQCSLILSTPPLINNVILNSMTVTPYTENSMRAIIGPLYFGSANTQTTLGAKPSIFGVYVGTAKDEFYSYTPNRRPQFSDYQWKPGKDNATQTWRTSNVTGILIGNPYDYDDSYFPTRRPWYIQAARAMKPTWTDLYVDAFSEVLTITASAPFIVNNTVVAVASVDYNINLINTFLQQLSTTDNGLCFIVNSEGYLIGASRGKILNDEYDLLRANETSNPVVNSITNYIQGLEKPGTTYKAYPTIAGKKYWVAVSTFDSELAWSVVVVIPDDDIMHQVYQSIGIVAGATGACLVVFILFALLFISFVVAPLNKLDTQMRKVSGASFDQTEDKYSPLYEIRNIQFSFFMMVRSLRTIVKRIMAQDIKLRSCIDAMPFFIVVINGNGGVTNTNAAFDEVFEEPSKHFLVNNLFEEDLTSDFFKNKETIDGTMRPRNNKLMPVQVTIKKLTRSSPLGDLPQMEGEAAEEDYILIIRDKSNDNGVKVEDKSQ